VVVIEPDQELAATLEVELAAQALRVVPVVDPERAEDVVESLHPDLVVLSQALPAANGLELMRRLKQGRRLPVVLLGDQGHVEERVRGLELGADDYLSKPFNVAELGSRIRAILRRWHQGTCPVLYVGTVEIHLARGLVLREGTIVRLTATEWHVLRYLAENHGRVVDGEELLGKVWGPGYAGQVHHLRVWVSRLRHKLEDDPSRPRVIRTVAGIGYMLDPDDKDARISA
jgi:two-component system KDP operon response regulator KdpE